MKTAIHSITLGIPAVTAIPGKRFVDYTGNPCAAGEKALAVSHAGGADAGEICPLALGIVLVEAGGPVTAGTDVDADANGKAVVHASGVVNGSALDTATTDGDIIRVKTI